MRKLLVRRYAWYHSVLCRRISPSNCKQCCGSQIYRYQSQFRPIITHAHQISKMGSFQKSNYTCTRATKMTRSLVPMTKKEYIYQGPFVRMISLKWSFLGGER